MAVKINHGTLLNQELNIATKISTLEERTANLEKEFECIGEAAKDLLNVVKVYVDKVETERKSWDLIDSIMESGTTASVIFSHMKIFFNFLLSKMEGYGVNITDVTMLWHLYNKEGVHEMFLKAIKSFGFKDSDESNIRLLLAVVYKQHTDLVQESPSTNEDDPQDAEQDNATKPLTASINNDKLQNDNEDKETKLLEHDFTKITLDSQNVEMVKSLHLEEPLKNVIKRSMAIVVYLLNVGRVGKTLSIIPEKDAALTTHVKDAVETSDVKDADRLVAKNDVGLNTVTDIKDGCGKLQVPEV